MAKRVAILAVLIALLAVSCGSDDATGDTDPSTTTRPTTTTTTAAQSSNLPQTEEEMCEHIQEFFDSGAEFWDAYTTIEEDYLTGITADERVEYARLMRSATTSTCPLLKTYAGDDGGILYMINS